MILNGLVSAYLGNLAITLCGGLLGAGWAAYILSRWHELRTSEGRYAMEKRISLLTGLFAILLIWRLLALPLWYYVLKSLVPSIPGAMCLYGVTAASPRLIWSATCIQLFLPFAFVVWFVWHHLDQELLTQPLLRAEIGMAVALGSAIAVSSFLDLYALASVRPRIVLCCTSLFDLPQVASGVFAVKALWPGYVALGLLFLALLTDLFLVIRQWRPAAGSFAVLWTTVIPLTSLVAITALYVWRLAPRVLHLPLHHCPFCLFERSLPSLAAYMAWFTAAWLTVGLAWAIRLGRDERTSIMNWAARKGGLIVGLQLASLAWAIRWLL